MNGIDIYCVYAMCGRMRLSKQSHTLAVLRLRAGLTQKEMAAALNCSAPTIQAVELGRLKLSEKLAGMASLKTGINLAWLLENDVTKPPIDIKGRPYTKAIFEEYQAITDIKKDPQMENEVALFCRDQTVGRLHALLLRAFLDNNTELCAYKLSKALDELEKQFRVTGADQKAVSPASLAPESKEKMTKEEKESFRDWGNCMTHFYRIMDLEEKKKIADWKMKPMSLAELKKRNINSVRLDDQGQVIVERFSKTKPIKTNPA
jgi:transcriptional regulator with XRE-family HTH domain